MKNKNRKTVTVKGFKAMRPDMTCRGFQFEVGKTFRHDGPLIPCKSGFHLCVDLQKIENYYDNVCRIFEVNASGGVIKYQDKTITDTLMVVKEINYLDYIAHDSNWVRSVVANKGIALDVLVNDDSWRVRAEVARQGYGLDVLINDPDWQVRYEVAQQGYGLDNLVYDKSEYVRGEVARQGHGLDVLLHDEEPDVRVEVAKHGYGLDILINDEYSYVRYEAKKKKNLLRYDELSVIL